MNLSELIHHPETMNKETLYDLRSLLAMHPYYQTARLLLLQNLYLLHDPSFDEELRRAAIYISDRRVIFNLVEAAHYRLRKEEDVSEPPKTESGSRTLSLIDQFLEQQPSMPGMSRQKRKPTAADAAIDYVSYLMQAEDGDEANGPAPEMKGQQLIDDFLKTGKIDLKDELEYLPELDEEKNDKKSTDDGFFTETLARIYIKQGRYSKALEIIKRINLNYPKKSVYFADQIRFLEKLIINNNKK